MYVTHLRTHFFLKLKFYLFAGTNIYEMGKQKWNMHLSLGDWCTFPHQPLHRAQATWFSHCSGLLFCSLQREPKFPGPGGRTALKTASASERGEPPDPGWAGMSGIARRVFPDSEICLFQGRESFPNFRPRFGQICGFCPSQWWSKKCHIYA